MFVTMKQPVASSRRRKFERVVFLVDVKVLIEQDDRRNCAAQIFSSVVTVLDRCNEHSRFSTLWGYVFFDSSRSPMASNTTIGRLVAGDPTRERFDGISQNLEKFGKVLEAVVASGDGYTSAGKSRADCLVRTLAAVASDFQWDPLFASDGTSSDEDMRRYLHHQTSDAVDLQSPEPEPNLAILFSCLPTCSRQLARFLDFHDGPVDLAFEEKLLYEFSSRFGRVQSVLDSKNITCCWIDVPARQDFSNSGLYEAYVNLTMEQSVARRCLFETAWNFVSLSLVANIINFVPLRLIWNMIAHLTPKFLCRQIVARCEAHVRCPALRLRRGYRDPTTSFSVEVQLWSTTVLSSSNAEHVSRLSRLFEKKNVDVAELSSTSNRVEIVILSKFSKRNPFKLSTERYLVLQKPSEAVISPTGTEKIQSDEQRSGELEAGKPSWPCLLISLESEESVALVTVIDGGCNCQAILEPFTPSSALLTVLDIAGSLPGRKHVSTRLGCHMSRISKICLKEKLEDHAKENGMLRSIDGGRKAGTAGIETGDISMFERSFDSTLLKIVKEKRRGCVLFKSVKKHMAERGKTLDSTHDLFQGSTSQPEKVSWQEYWRRVVKCLQREHLLLDNNCTRSSSLGVIKSSIDLSSVEQKMIHFQVTGTSREGLEPVSDLGLFGQGSESTLLSAVRHVPSKPCISVSSAPPAVGGDLQLSPTISADHTCPSFSTSPHRFQCRSLSSKDEVQAEREVLLTPTPELPIVCTAMIEENAHRTANLVGIPFKAGVKEDAILETSPGYSSIKQLIRSVLTSEGVDLHQFAESVVSEAYKKFRLADDNEVVIKGILASETASSQTSNASVAVRMKQLLLKRPKHLLSKYKELLASATTTTTCKAFVVAEKLREHELQILFRLEILALDGEFHDKGRQECLTRDICQLLDNIQFHLVGGSLSEESLQQYCDRVIISRYKALLPSTISKIFSAMELNGYCEPSLSSSVYVQGLQTSGTQPSSENVVSQSEHEVTEPSSDAPGNSLGQQKGLLPNRSRLSSGADCKSRFINEVITSHSKNSSGKENLSFYSAVQDLPHEQEKKQRKIYHFSSGTHNLLRVKAVKPRDHAAIRARKIVNLSRCSAGRTLDLNMEVQITDRTPVLVKEVRVLQNRGKDLQIVCQTPKLKLEGLTGGGRRLDMQGDC